MIPIYHGIPCEGLVPFIKLYMKSKKNGFCVKLENGFWFHLDPVGDQWKLDMSPDDKNYPTTFCHLKMVEKYGQTYLQGFYGMAMITFFFEGNQAIGYFSNNYPREAEC